MDSKVLDPDEYQQTVAEAFQVLNNKIAKYSPQKPGFFESVSNLNQHQLILSIVCLVFQVQKEDRRSQSSSWSIFVRNSRLR